MNQRTDSRMTDLRVCQRQTDHTTVSMISRLNAPTEMIVVFIIFCASSKSLSPVTRKSASAARAQAMKGASFGSRWKSGRTPTSICVVSVFRSASHLVINVSGSANRGRLRTERYSSRISGETIQLKSPCPATKRMTSSGVLSRKAADMRTLVSMTTFTRLRPPGFDFGEDFLVGDSARWRHSLSVLEKSLQFGQGVV